MDIKHKLLNLFENWANEKAISINKLPISGSNREYFRIISENKKAVAAVGYELKENIAFIEFSKFLKEKGLKVPEIYAVAEDKISYLIEDFGDVTLYDFLEKNRKGVDIPNQIKDYYKKAITQLILFQTESSELDYSLCYPRHTFDNQSIMWDLNYFKYYFLKLGDIIFDEQLLENDFQKFAEYLTTVDNDYFMYRDFQSRNIMIVDNELAFIDYQGGRKGALQYDLASLLYDAKADLPKEFRESLLDFYIENISQKIEIDKSKFKTEFYFFVLMRIMQAMGAYGFRGYFEKKEHFLKSIPFAIENLKYILTKVDLSEYPMLKNALEDVTKSSKLIEISKSADLTVAITSFSYKKGIPVDTSGNGGGFVFDCRAINNPGRYPEYRDKTGRDKEVIDFFAENSEIDIFLEDVYKIVDRSVENYLERGFKNLMVNFGCTGGRHRSVYCADSLAKYLKERYGVRINLRHVEQNF